MRDCSESEAPNNARASAFFLRVALEGSWSVAVPETTSVFNSVGGLGSFGRGACMLSTTESKRALAFAALSCSEDRGGDPCEASVTYPCVRHVVDDYWTYVPRYPARWQFAMLMGAFSGESSCDHVARAHRLSISQQAIVAVG